MAVSASFACDGREVVSVMFERQGPEADTPVVEVIWQVVRPEDFQVPHVVVVILLLSATRTDTREPVILTAEERQASIDEAAAYLTKEIEDLPW